MSKQVDERVVSMQFDNKNFEKNVQTSMSTLDKLKAKLNFDGASKGLENINSAAKKIDMSGLASGIEVVKVKFSSLEVMGVTALANITNSAVNAGKRMVSALTIDPVKTGFQEYETQLNSVQTILANTKSKGSTLEDVNNALNTLNTYADQTIYNFTEMTRNIGTFTAAGVDLQTSVDSIKGIANLAAVSGSSSAQASNAMYQLSQALAAGKVTLMDWNSVVNAGMGGEVFQNALIRTSELLKTGAKQAINTYGSFRESLTQGEWLTTEVLTETLKQLSGAYTEADLISQGFSKEQTKEITDLANTAKGAATDIKTFTQLWDVMKEAAQSGWAQTWQLIIGDFEEAKALLSPIAEFFTNAIGKMSDARNKLLDGALSKNFTKLSETISGVTTPIKNAADAVKDFGNIVDRVIIGEFGNGEDRINKLTDAGYNYYAVQNKVNETLNNSFRYTDEVISSQDKLLSNQNGLTESNSKLAESTQNSIEKLVEMSDTQLKNLGYTDKQIEALRELKTEADKLGMPLQEFIDSMDELNGRTLLINSFKNIFNGLISVLKTVRKAWQNVFPPKSMEERQEGLYNLIAAFHKFSTAFKKLSEEADKNGTTINKLRRTLEGLFTILKIVKNILGGPLKIAFKIISKILGMFNLDILDVTAFVGDAIVAFDKWLESVLDFNKVFEGLVTIVKSSYKAIQNWIDTIKSSENVPKAIADSIMNGLGKAVEFVVNLFKNLSTSIQNGFNGVPGNIISGFVNGIWNGMKTVGQVMVELGKNILEKFRGVLGIHSPSTETYSDGQNFMTGFLNGLKDFSTMVWDFIKTFGQKCIDILSNLNFGDVIAGIWTISSAVFMKKLGGVSDSISGMLDGVSGIFKSTEKILDKSAKPIAKILKNTAKVVKSFSKVMNGVAFDMKAEGIKKLAESVAILVGCIVILTFFDPAKLWNAVVVVGVLAGVLLGLALLTEKMSKSTYSLGKNSIQIENASAVIKGIAKAILMLAIAAKIVNSISWEDFGKVALGMAFLAGIVVGLISATRLAGNKIDDIGKTILQVAAAIGILAIVAKMITKMSWEDLEKAGAGITFLGGIITGLISATKLAGNKIDDIGKTILQISAAIAILMVVGKIIARMSWEELLKAGIGITFLGGIIKGLISATALAGNKIDDIGKTILQISAAIAILAITAKIIAGMSWNELGKAAIGIGFLTLIITYLIKATKLAGNKIDDIGRTIMGIGVAMLLLAITAKVIATMKVEEMAKAAIGIGFLSLIITYLIKATTLAGNKLDKVGLTIVLVAAAIAILAVVAGTLGFLPIDKLAIGIIAVGLLAVIIGRLIKATDKAKHAKATMMILGAISACMLVMAGIIYLLSLMPVKSVIVSVGALSVLMIVMTGVLNQLIKIGKNARRAVRGVEALTAMALPLVLFVKILELMQNVQNGIKSAIALSILAFVMTGLLTPLVRIGKDVKQAIKGVLALTAMVLPLLAFTLVLALMSGVQNAIVNVIALSILATAMTALLMPLILVGKYADDAIKGVGALTVIALPLLAFTLVLALMSGVQNAIVNVIALSILTAAMTALLIPLILVGKNVEDAIKGVVALTAICIPLAICAGILYAISGIENAIANADALSTMLVAMAAVTVILAKAGVSAAAAAKGAAAFDAVVAIIAGLIAGLGAIYQIPGVDTLMNGGIEMLAKIGEGLGKLIGGIVAGFAEELLSVLPYLGEQLSLFMENAKPFIEGCAAITEQVLVGAGILAGAILALSVADLIAGITNLIPFCPSLPQLGSDLSAFMLNALPFLVIASTVDPATMTGVKTLADTIIVLTAANLLDGITRFLTGGSSIATFGQELIPLGTGLKGFSDEAKGVDTTTVTAAAEAAKTIADMTHEIPNSGGVVSWFTGDNSIAKFSGEIILLGKGLKGFSDEVKDIVPANVTAAAGAAKSIADMTHEIPNSGGVVSWFTGDNSIAQFGGEIVALGRGLNGFSEAVKNIVPANVTAAAGAAKSIANMTHEIPKEGGVKAWFEGESSISKFSVEMVFLGKGLKGFSDAVKNIVPANVTAAAGAAKSIADMTHEIPNSGGVVSWFTGDNSIAQFGGEIVALGRGLNGFSEAVKNIVPANVKAAAGAAKTIADMTHEIPKEGGVKAWFEGESSISKFSVEMVFLGKGLKGFSDAVKNIVPANVTAAAGAAKSIANMTHEIPKEGGVKAWFEGESSISKFSVEMVLLGKGLKGFSDEVEGIIPANVTAAAGAAKSLAEMTQTIPKEGGFKAWFEGESSIVKFSGELEKLGQGLKGFAAKFGETKPEIVKAGADAAVNLANMANTVPADNNNLANLGTNLEVFGDDLYNFFENISWLSGTTINNAIDATNRIVGLSSVDPGKLSKVVTAISTMVSTLKEASTIEADATTGFKSAIETLAKTDVNNFIRTFNDASPDIEKASGNLMNSFIRAGYAKGSNLLKVGRDLVGMFTTGVKDKNENAKSVKAFADLIEECSKAISETHSTFYNAGIDLVRGFADGIDAHTYEATDKAKAMAQASLEAAKKELDENSPSKKFYKIGAFAGQGFVNALGDYERKSYRASTNLAESAKLGLSRAINKIKSVIDNDIDTQPTIRPVIDLTDIASGANSINDMFSITPSIGLMSNINSINSTMNNRKTGVNDDVISAIEDLGRKIGNTSGNTYTINGITYDDGSSISEAIKSLVRAARIERRI